MNTNNSSFSGPWTNEKHVHFLNSMEASFVRTMLENNSCFLPLDRYLPDTSDSTSDLKTQRRKKNVTSASGFAPHPIVGPISGMDRRAIRQSNQNQAHNSSQDQVVPQRGKRTDDDKEERDPSGAPANSNSN